MLTLGINAAFHDCAACAVRDGVVIAAAEEERFTRIKHGKRPVPFSTWQLPFHAIDYCLREADMKLGEVDHFAYSFDARLLEWPEPRDNSIRLPLEPSREPAGQGAQPWDGLFLSYLVNAPRQLASGTPHGLRQRLGGVRPEHIQSRWQPVEHHLAHEASAFLAAPFEDCAVLTLDGRGERASTSCGVWRQGRYQRLRQVNLPHSLGLLYEDFTRWLGFLHSADEYKVMALAAFGEPRYTGLFRELVQADGAGGYTVDRTPMEALFGTPRQPGAPLEERHHHLATSLQQVLEETVLGLARWLHAETGAENLAMAGGVAFNCVMNARLRDEGPFRRVWVQPAAGDAGTALGAALWTDHCVRRERLGSHTQHWAMQHAYLGPAFSESEIEAELKRAKLRYRRLDEPATAAAALLAADRILGWFQGRMEFGPRALGARSILASPLSADMQQRLNEIKDREDFRPVAPVVLEHRAAAWFAPRGPSVAADGGLPSPYMLFNFQVREDRAARIPAVRHIDGSARLQTLHREQQPQLFALLQAFEQRTGVPVLVNTSFNTRGQPIVCTPREALECYWTSPLDALVIGPFLLEKSR